MIGFINGGIVRSVVRKNRVGVCGRLPGKPNQSVRWHSRDLRTRTSCCEERRGEMGEEEDENADDASYMEIVETLKKWDATMKELKANVNSPLRRILPEKERLEKEMEALEETLYEHKQRLRQLNENYRMKKSLKHLHKRLESCDSLKMSFLSSTKPEEGYLEPAILNVNDSKVLLLFESVDDARRYAKVVHNKTGKNAYVLMSPLKSIIRWNQKNIRIGLIPSGLLDFGDVLQSGDSMKNVRNNLERLFNNSE